jgi:hypothetical protein
MGVSYTGMTATVLLLWTGWQVGEVSARYTDRTRPVQTSAPPPSVWSVVPAAGRRRGPAVASTKTMLTINHEALSSALAAAALQEDPTAFSFASVLGRTLICNLAPSLGMAPELQAKFPTLLAMIGSCVDENGENGGTVSVVLNTDLEDPKAQASLSVTFFTKNQWVYIDRDDEDTESRPRRGVAAPNEDTEEPTMYSMMLRRDIAAADSSVWEELPPIDPALLSQAQGNGRRVRVLEDHSRNLQAGNTAYLFQFAVATTKEYAASVSATTVAQVLVEVVTVMTRINGIYLRELGVFFQLIAKSNELICIAGDGSTCNAWPNDTSLNDIITNADDGEGNSNVINYFGPAGLMAGRGVYDDEYDLGHAFTSAGGGIAYVGVLCRDSGDFTCGINENCGWKARGISGSSNPTSEGFVRLLAHEIGHQLAGLHSFRNCPSNPNEDAQGAAEAGSGTTIMSYAGNCGTTNVQTTEDFYFHGINIVTMRNHIESQVAAKSCGSAEVLSAKPEMDTLSTYTVPKGNYVQLGGRVSNTGAWDPENIFYAWDRVDTNEESYLDLNVPRFRSHEPTTRSALRFLPNLYLLSYDLVDAGGQLEERPPQDGVGAGNKVMMFRFIGRTMYSPGATAIPTNMASLAGQFGWTDLELTYDEADAPLQFSPATLSSLASTGLTGGVSSTFSWSGGTIHTDNVEILIATNTMEDEGLGYDYDTDVDDLEWVSMGVFVNSDGTATATVPTLIGTTAVLMIRSINRSEPTNTDVYFFDLAPNFVYTTGAASDPPSTSPSVSEVPSTSPSGQPSTIPSSGPSTIPSLSPSDIPSEVPSLFPSDIPSEVPSLSPSDVPSEIPSVSPSDLPSLSPSEVPSLFPSDIPSEVPSLSPSEIPSEIPSVSPSEIPSLIPSSGPSVSQAPSTESVAPSGSQAPSSTPSISLAPSSIPSGQPSRLPSSTPSDMPSLAPSSMPSVTPSLSPSSGPSALPSISPSSGPSAMPSLSPSDVPSLSPSSGPSEVPSLSPSDVPSASLSPSSEPSVTPSSEPSVTPSSVPSNMPSPVPSEMPSTIPSTAPSEMPSTSMIPSTISIVCPVESKNNGRAGIDEDEDEGEEEDEEEEETVLPICVVKTYKGRASRTVVKTVCGKGGKGGKGKGDTLENFTVGCCDPVDEGDSYPDFCRGPPLCEGQQTPCKSSGKGSGKGRPMRGQTGGRLLRTRGGGKKGNAIAICEEGETLCIGDYDLDYYGTDPQCGPCLL